MDLINGTEQEIAQALGVEMPQESDQGENGQEIADPAEGQSVGAAALGGPSEDEGQPNASAPQGAAEPSKPSPAGDAGTGNTAAPSPAGDAGTGYTAAPSPAGDAGTLPPEGGGLEGAGQKGQEMPEEERRANAARRRQQETQAAIDAAVQAERARMEQEYQQREQQLFADANLKNSSNGQPITNRKEFYAWKEAYDAARLQKDLAAGKLTPEGLNRAIAANPTVRQMREEAERQAQASRQRQQAEMRARADQEIAEIGKLDPTVKSLQDILDKPTGKAFYDYVQRGNNFVDAYYLANRQELAARQQQAAAQQAQAARQQAAANARSKGHLNPVPAGRGEGSASVPEADMRIYRALMPEATEAEIRSAYNDYMKTRK